jgi:hypothetical protein
MFPVCLARNGVLPGMTNDQFEHHAYRMSTEPSYQAGYRSGLSGEATPRHTGVLLEPVAWAHGWRAGVTEATDNAETIADWMSRAPRRRRFTIGERPTIEVESRWVVARYGVQQAQFLSLTRIWGTIGNAAWFTDRNAAHAAMCPPGTTGIAVQMDVLRRAS